MEKRYQIFISSTYKDLIEERQKVTQGILKLYHFPIGMEMFHADNEEQWTQIKKTIDMSDYYVLIIGRYCGTLIEDEGISYTEKEYDYAISRGIPVLIFIMSDDAKKEAYGTESNKQKKALSRFIKKVKKLPCEFWKNSDELAYQVTSTLSMKFKEDNRNGWKPFNPYEIKYTERIDACFVGNYDVIYYTELKGRNQKKIKSKLVINNNGTVLFYNNIKTDIADAEYTYHGICKTEESTVYIYLENDFSSERATIYFIKPVGQADRFIGLFIALSSNMNPICIKLACFKESLYNNGINEPLLKDIITSSNVSWENNMLIIEEEQKHLFFSDDILMIKSMEYVEIIQKIKEVKHNAETVYTQFSDKDNELEFVIATEAHRVYESLFVLEIELDKLIKDEKMEKIKRDYLEWKKWIIKVKNDMHMIAHII